MAGEDYNEFNSIEKDQSEKKKSSHHKQAKSQLQTTNFVEDKEPRTSKLHRMDFFIKPKNMMKNIHCRTHFKAAISLSRGDPCCLKI